MKRHIFSALILLTAASNIFAEEGIRLYFKQNKGDISNYVSTVEEDVYYNRQNIRHAQIINRISSQVKESYSDGSADLTTSYMTTENTLVTGTSQHLSWGEEFISDFSRDKNGRLTISDNLFMPTVRNVPVFPDKKVAKGETWSAEGKEVHDLRHLFNMNEPVIIPFAASYKYANDETINGTVFNIIEVNYNFYHENSQENIKKGSTFAGTSGYSKQKLYWDDKRGILDHYEEEFLIKMVDIYGNLYEFTGTAKAYVTEFKSVNNEETEDLLRKKVEKYRLENISVKRGEMGITISLDKIQFEPDSNILKDSEKIKLQKIGEILKDFSNDLLITGHCAERGSVNARQKLSEERAESVAAYLENLGIRDKYHIYTQGKGSREPVASNATEEGRIQNRRVEITIMDR